MKNYRLFSLVALLLLALVGSATSFVVADAPVKAAAAVPAATIGTTSTTSACPNGCVGCPGQPCTPEQCAARCGVDLKTAQECQKTAACQTGARCAMVSSQSGNCPMGKGRAQRSK